MKKIIATSILLMFTITTLFSQTEKRNIIKLYPTSMAFGKTTLGYERVLNENGSFTFNLGLPTGMNFESYVPSETEEGLDVTTGKLKGFLLMPGYRLNFSKKGAPLGFYLDTYAKYENFNMIINGEYLDEGERNESNIDGTFGAFGAGFAFGAQCLIGDVVSLDLTFFGLEAKAASLDVTWLDKSGHADIDAIYADMESSLTDIPEIGDKVELSRTEHSVNAKLKNQFMPGFRFAFSLGIAF